MDKALTSHEHGEVGRERGQNRHGTHWTDTGWRVRSQSKRPSLHTEEDHTHLAHTTEATQEEAGEEDHWNLSVFIPKDSMKGTGKWPMGRTAACSIRVGHRTG